jgi:ribosomal protein S18 acetylase RimI-like enzyme
MTFSPTDLTMTLARPDELDVVLGIYDEAAQWVTERGFGHWEYPQPQWIRQLVAMDIEQSRVYLARARNSDHVLGTLRILWRDAEVWPEDGDEAGYVHGLAIRAEARGRGLGAQMLDWAATHIRAQGKRFLRLDCDAGNSLLCGYYERLGFAFRGEVSAGHHVGARYEKALLM